MKTPANIFKRALSDKKQQIGLWLSLASSYSAEIVAGVGYDWLLIDGEHAPNDIRNTLAQLQGISSAHSAFIGETGSTLSHPAVRVPVGETSLIKQYLDIGVQTILVPMIDTAEQAQEMAQAMRYPPQGVRGMGAGLARASRWNSYPNYIREANDEVCLLVQAETVEAMRNLDAIAATPGVDGVFIGPSDLSASMGHLGNAAHPDVQAAIADGIARILKAGKAPGILSATEEQARKWLDAGALFVAVGMDTNLLKNSAAALLKKFKDQ